MSEGERARALPPRWAWATLEDLSTKLQYGYTAKAESGTSTVRMLRITDIRDDGVDWGRVPGCAIDDEEEQRFLLKDGDIVFARSGSIGKAWLVRDAPRSVFASYLIRSSPVAGWASEWIGRFIISGSFLRQAEIAASGIGMSNISAAKIGGFALPIPPLGEQRRIVAKLDELLAGSRRAREALDAVPALLEQYRRSVLAAAFRGELTAEWRSSHTSAEWKQVTLNDVCRSVADGDHQAPPQSANGVPFITIGAISDGKLRLDRASRCVPDSYYNGLKPERQPARGDVLYSVTGSIGISVSVDVDSHFSFQRHIAILKPDARFVVSEFLCWRLAADDIRQQGDAVATGTAQRTIPLGGLRKFTFYLPSIDEQREIVSRVGAAIARIDTVRAGVAEQRAQLDALDRAILDKAFRGELVPQDPNDEPASVMLERLRAERAAAGTEKKPRGRRRSKDAEA